MGVTIQLRRDTASNWTTNNPTLLAGEIGYETDTGKFKIGDGSTAWTSLNYVIVGLLSTSLPENTCVILDSALSADGKYSGITFAGTAGAALAFGEVVYFASADSKWEKTDASAEATTKPRIAIVVSGGVEDAAVVLMAMGYIREDDWNWTTPGAPLFIDEDTAGALNETAPAGSGECVRIAGYVVDANTIFFCPEGAWDELA